MPNLSAYAPLYWILGIIVTTISYRFSRLEMKPNSVNGVFNVVGLIGVFLCWPLHLIFLIYAFCKLGSHQFWQRVSK